MLLNWNWKDLRLPKFKILHFQKKKIDQSFLSRDPLL